MPSKKRARHEIESEESASHLGEAPTTLHRLRNMWQFANLAQYLHFFIDALKLDKDFDIEDLETECLSPQPSEKLAQIGLSLLKHVSSHKGLTPDIFDEYTRRQFVAKAPHRNPFGTEESPAKFDDLDVFTKVRVLQQLSAWTLNNPNSIRERLNADDATQADWRIEPFGWDRDDRTLFLLDDNRLYRHTDAPPPPPPPKVKGKAKSNTKHKGGRSSKRRKISAPEPEEVPEEEGEVEIRDESSHEDDGLGGAVWECLCISLEEYQDYMSGLRRSRDANEKELFRRLESEVIPVIERQAEERARKEARRMKEAETLLKLATAKRSSRISSRLEKQKAEEEAEATERKRLADVAMAEAEQEKQRKLEEDRDSRRMTREQRLKERETKRILEEEQLRKLKEDEEKLASNEARLSERHLRAEMARREKELKKLQEEDQWVFDCEKCNKHGDNFDDGTHSIACDKCGVWQHSKCNGISQAQADRADFHFTCSYCRRNEAEAKQPKLPPLKLRLTPSHPSTSRPQTNGSSPATIRRSDLVQVPSQRPSTAHQWPHAHQAARPLLNGPSLSPRGQALGPPGIQRSEAAYGTPQTLVNGSSPAPTRPHSSGYYGGNQTINGFPVSSPPQYRTPQPPTSPFNPGHEARPMSNGSPYMAPNPFKPADNSRYNSSFSRPTSSTSASVPQQSPVKHSPAPSPRPASGISKAYDFTNSPHSSFPPPTSLIQQPSFSPTKHSSPPPPIPQMSSPAASVPLLAHSPVQYPAQVLPDPLPVPEKHDGFPPASSHNISETTVLPPLKSLSPDAKPQISRPPMKKPSPTPEKAHLVPFSSSGNTSNGSNGFSSAQ